MVASSVKSSDAGGGAGGAAGLSLTRSGGANNPNPIQHGGMGQAERAFSAASTFLSGVMAISASQFIGAPLKIVDPKFYDGYMAWTKESFAVLMTTITQFWSPTVVRVSGDESMKGQLYLMDDGSLKCNFPHRLVLMANHQLYTDWLYLWWIAYTNKMHGRIYIILKESLKKLPIIGWGAQFYNFIFLSRKWETDRWRFKRAISHLQNPQDPMWLLIFPEGTNLSAVTREKSASWAKKSGVTDMKHQLLPRTTGLQFCLQELRQTTNWLYDCTIAYEGVPKGQYGQDIFTLKSSFFEGRPPKSVNMFWRRFKISDIPIDNDEAFGRWLNNRWREKDYILEYYDKFSQFPADDAIKALAAAEGKREPNHAKAINTELKGGGWDEFLSIFGPITTAAGALSSVDMTEPMNFDLLMSTVAKQQQLNLLKLGKAPIASTSEEAIRNALVAANKKKALPQPVIDYLVKQAPQTQAAMKQALQQAGNADIAKKVSKAPAAPAQVSTGTQQHLARVAQQTQNTIAKSTPPTPRADPRQAASNATEGVKTAMPMANMEAMITRPLSTMAVHTVANKVRNAAAQRTREKGAALPGQPAATARAKPAVGGKGVKQPNGNVSGGGNKKPPAVSHGEKVVKKATPLTTANLNAVNASATKKRGGASKPIGAQKYPSG